MKSVWTLLVLALPLWMCGQETELTVEVSSQQVKVGEVFKLTISLKNGQGEIKTPELNGFEIVSGPNYASRFSMVNGKTDMSSSYEYNLMAQEKGTYIIDPAEVEVDGVLLTTDPITIDVEYDPNYSPSPSGPMRKAKKKKGIRL